MQSGYIYIASNIFETLIAISSEEQSRGLMYEEPPAPIMSFVYDVPGINKFWMKNTKAPLDIVFCNSGKVDQICSGEPYSTRIIGSNSLSDLIVEFPFGTMNYCGIKLGDNAGIIKPTKLELKKIIAQVRK